MASLTIRNLDDKVKARLRVRAAKHGRSMEDEVREILRVATAEGDTTGLNLAHSVRRRFAAFGGVDLELPCRDPLRSPPGFES